MEWQNIFRQLVAENLLRVDIAEHGGLKITPKGHSFLKEKRKLALRIYSGKGKTKTSKKVTVNEFADSADENLYIALKNKRAELAKSENVPPYIIFHDRSLREMASGKPSSLEDFRNISGVGEHKIKRYGQIFLEVISEY